MEKPRGARLLHQLLVLYQRLAVYLGLKVVNEKARGDRSLLFHLSDDLLRERLTFEAHGFAKPVPEFRMPKFLETRSEASDRTFR